MSDLAGGLTVQAEILSMQTSQAVESGGADIDLWRRQLRSRSRGEGYQAADRLAGLGAEGKTLLIKALDSRDRNVRVHAAWAARKLGSVNALIKIIELLRQDPEFYLPLQQCITQQQSSVSDFLPPLVTAAKDRRNPQRKFHMMLLGELSQAEVGETLLIGIQSDDQAQQEGAFLALKHACRSLREAAAPGLVLALSVRLPLPTQWRWTWTATQKASQTVPLSLIAAVGLVSGEAAVGVLTEILRSNSHPQYRLAAISALITVGEVAVSRCARSLVQVLKIPEDNLLAQAASEALRRLRAEQMEDELLELLGSSLAFQRRHAADALEGCAARREAFEKLTQRALRDSDVHVRRTAVRTLVRSSVRNCEDDLLDALGDKDRWVAWNAAWALGERWRGQVVPAPAIDRLLRSLESPLPRLRRAAAEALGQIAPHSPEVVEALVASLGDRKSEVCRSAAWALRQIDLSEALAYAAILRATPDRRVRVLGIKALRWLQPRFSSYTPHLPVRSSGLTGHFDEA